MCVAVVDAAGNRGSTCAELADVEVDVEPPAFLATPTVVGRTATSIDVLVEMSEPGKASWRPLHECQTGQASSTCDVKTGNTANAPTGDAAIPNAPTPTVITIPVNPAWLSQPGDGVVQIEWEMCDSAGNCGPGNPTTQDVLLPPPSAVLPTLVPTIVKVNEDEMVVDLAHGDGGDQACWAVLVMTEPATAATAPPRLVSQGDPSASARDCSRRRCGAAIRRRRTRAPRFRRTAQSRAWSSRDSPARRRTACTPRPAAPIPATTPRCCASSRRTTHPDVHHHSRRIDRMPGR